MPLELRFPGLSCRVSGTSTTFGDAVTTKRIWEYEGKLYKLTAWSESPLTRESLGDYWTNWMVHEWDEARSKWSDGLHTGEAVMPLISMSVEYDFVQLD